MAQSVTDDSISGDGGRTRTQRHTTKQGSRVPARRERAVAGKVELPPAQLHRPTLGSLPRPPASSLVGGRELSPSDYPPGHYLPILISPETSPWPLPCPPSTPHAALWSVGSTVFTLGLPCSGGDLAPSEGQVSATADSLDSNPGCCTHSSTSPLPPVPQSPHLLHRHREGPSPHRTHQGEACTVKCRDTGRPRAQATDVLAASSEAQCICVRFRIF